MMHDPRPWWQTSVFYQIYPRSFADGNGDGIGDLPGIIGKLSYLRDLGIGAIWLSPHYPSPQFDMGYDVADYTGVNPEYGTAEDFQRFLLEAHARGIRVVLDLVLNHTSAEHPWFKESRSSRSNPRRDWYVWRDPRDGRPPNNWESIFGGPAWEWDEVTGQYYYHFFFKQQPDLNWRNPAVKHALFEVVRHWFRLGVDGFRVDAVSSLFEDPAERDHEAELSFHEILRRGQQGTPSEAENAHLREQRRRLFAGQWLQPELYDVLRELRRVCDEFPDRVLIGEHDRQTMTGRDKLHMVFNFPLMQTDRLTPAWVRNNQRARLAGRPRGAWPANTLGNHDTSRLYTRYGDRRYDPELARLAAAVVLLLQGTPFIYYGEEIGMTDSPVQTVDELRDHLSIWLYETATRQWGEQPAEALRHAIQRGRDKCRTPMAWENAPNGGFCPADVRPWLPVGPGHARGVNVADEVADPRSLLNFYRRLLAVRRGSPALQAGDYVELDSDAEDHLAFLRSADEQTCLVVLNFSAAPLTVDFPGLSAKSRLFSSTTRTSDDTGPLAALSLAPFEVVILETM